MSTKQTRFQNTVLSGRFQCCLKSNWFENQNFICAGESMWSLNTQRAYVCSWSFQEGFIVNRNNSVESILVHCHGFCSRIVWQKLATTGLKNLEKYTSHLCAVFIKAAVHVKNKSQNLFRHHVARGALCPVGSAVLFKVIRNLWAYWCSD